MSQNSSVNMTLPPPLVPLSILREAPPKPVPPPIFLGNPAANAGAAVPHLVAGSQGKKKERRMELTGLETGDPLSTVHLLKLGLKNAASIVPKLITKYWWVILIVGGLWYGLHVFNAIALSMRYPRLSPLFMTLNKLAFVGIFFTATYNNFVAKAIYATLVIRVGLPLCFRVKNQGFGKVVRDFKEIGPGLKKNWAKAGGIALSLLVAFSGVGAFISNYLTRNNRIDKIAVSLALALALMKALSDGPKSLPFMAGRVVMKDLFVMMLKPSPVKNHHIYLAVSGLSIGLLCSLPFAYLSKITSDNLGYIIGGLGMIAGLVLYFLQKALPKGQS